MLPKEATLWLVGALHHCNLMKPRHKSPQGGRANRAHLTNKCSHRREKVYRFGTYPGYESLTDIIRYMALKLNTLKTLFLQCLAVIHGMLSFG